MIHLLLGDTRLWQSLKTETVAARLGFVDDLVLCRRALAALEEELAPPNRMVADMTAGPPLVDLCAHCARRRARRVVG